MSAILDSYSITKIKGGEYNLEAHIDGLVGFNRNTITKTYAAGTLETNTNVVGGLIGKNISINSVNNSYYDQRYDWSE